MTLPILRPAYAPIRRTTTNGTALSVFRVNVPADGGAELDIAATGTRRSTGISYFFRRVLRVRNDGGVISVPSITASVPDDNAAGYAVSYVAVTGGVEVTVTGAGGHTVDWCVNPIALTL